MNGQKNARKKINEIGACDHTKQLLELRILGNTTYAEIGSTIAIEVNNQIFAPIHDLCGNITALINTETKKIQESYFYNAFGEEEKISSSEIQNPWRFSSKRKDPETDLIFFGRRYYNPIEGRFCTPDPLGLTNSMNLYAFALNDPLMRIDLYGLMAILQYPLMGTEPLFSMEPYNTSQSATPAAIDFTKGCYWGYNEVYEGNSLHTPITPAELYGQRFGRSLGMAQGISEMCMGTYVTAAGIAGQIGSGIGTIGTGGAASMVTVPVFAASLATTATGGMVSAHGYSMFKNAQNLPELKSGSSTKLTKNIESVTQNNLSSQNILIPIKITGYTKHALNQAIGRNWGRGVKASYIIETLTNPIKIVAQEGGKLKIIGKNATVIINSEKKIITTFGKSRGPQIWNKSGVVQPKK